VDPTTLTKLGPQSDKPAVQATPTLPLEMCIDLDDIEKAGRSVISEKARTYISSAADSLHSLENNLSDWSKIVFRPRVLRNVTTVDLSTYILGVHCRLPFFVAPTGLVGLTHPDGELCLVRGAAQTGVHCGVSTASTRSREDIIECMKAEQNKLPKSLRGVSHVLFQLYVNSDAEITKTIVRQARELGYKGLFITVDTPVSGKRNADSRLRAREELESGISRKPALAPEEADESENLRLRAAGGLSKTLNWTDLSWIRKAWSGPIVLKGIQRWEDAKQAVLMGVEGIYLSNHGGRQLHSAPSSLNTLIEIRTYCPEILERCEIYVDGGIRRGGDIIKALCLGAKAVGIGRPFLYAIGAHGVDGFLRAVSSGLCFVDQRSST
jgi:L-lactate dehydrogenase (cytochrome)